MASPSIQYFDISFIERTLENLKKYEGKYDFTMLLNSLLGLLIVPNECNIKQKSFEYPFLKKKVNNFSKLRDVFKIKLYIFLDEKGREIEQNKFKWLGANNKELDIDAIALEDLLKRIRNGIAHFGITPVKEDALWKGVIIKNSVKGKINMEIYLDKEELKIFALFIAEKYIETIKRK